MPLLTKEDDEPSEDTFRRSMTLEKMTAREMSKGEIDNCLAFNSAHFVIRKYRVVFFFFTLL